MLHCNLYLIFRRNPCEACLRRGAAFCIEVMLLFITRPPRRPWSLTCDYFFRLSDLHVESLPFLLLSSPGISQKLVMGPAEEQELDVIESSVTSEHEVQFRLFH